MTSIEADRRPNWKQDRTGGDATTWRDHRDDTTADDEQRRRGDDRRWGPDHDARVRGGDAVGDVESRGRDVSGDGGCAGDAIETAPSAKRRWGERGDDGSEATTLRGRRSDGDGEDNGDVDEGAARATRRWGWGGDERHDPKPPQRGTAIDDRSAGDSDR
ncbi:hypothetical protein [Halorubrum ezzemoulense]|uniref:hypothetical protein n=1 Tax=Halorubrum ezzemoulense TaxID=337243 RepID=UPI00233038B3|nr:hypothetical protein [Halorubrum ezzemoulense]MDB2249840.1 hypothetical protein [Halorubrum ezzemoulense]